VGGVGIREYHDTRRDHDTRREEKRREEKRRVENTRGGRCKIRVVERREEGTL